MVDNNNKPTVSAKTTVGSLYKIQNEVRLIELFGGVGTQAMALKTLGVPFEHYRYIEYDKFPVASYNAIHGTSFEPTDISNVTGKDLGIVDTDKYTYILTYSFPCTSLSLAGKREGMVRNSGTTSSLLWEVERLLKECENLPQILIMENVTQVHSKTVNKKTNKSNLEGFTEWCDFLYSLGYSSFWKDMNSRNFGVAQNRNRTIMVSILGDYTFEFPSELDLHYGLKDYLEPIVDEKYYLKSDRANKLIENLVKENRIPNYNQVSGTVIGSTQKNAYVGKLDSVSPTLTEAMGTGGGQIPMIVEEVYIAAMRGRNPENPSDRTTGSPTEQRLEIQHENICNTLTTVQKDNLVLEKYKGANYKIRKLTPRECWRLMDFSDIDFDKAAEVNSNTQLYKEAGNAIVKNILVSVIGQLFTGKEEVYKNI